MTRLVDVYLLHFDRPVGRVSHYWGQTAHGRILRRMAEHQAGRGSTLTHRAHIAGIGFSIGAIIENVAPDLERKLKRRGHACDYCAICDPPPFVVDNPLIGRHFDPLQVSEPSPFIDFSRT